MPKGVEVVIKDAERGHSPGLEISRFRVQILIEDGADRVSDSILIDVKVHGIPLCVAANDERRLDPTRTVCV
ncbi:hypothetical protein RRG08_054993 [Elysia crispata]|uniref:Uncharacterized protein n=1 Tax=Elysia crispata TaxID=231223 RepID=A0AAE0XSP4_9GAST|nr:hypothetical protein RRG08_054993 [Elysia crispata]